MTDNIQAKLHWLSFPAVLFNGAKLVAENAAFSSLTAEIKTALMHKLALIVSNSDIRQSGYKNVHLGLTPHVHYEANVMVQPDTAGYAALFYPLKQSSGITELYASVFKHSIEAIMITDADDNIIAVNHAFVKTTGFTEQQVLYRKPDFLRRGLNEKATLKQVWQSVQKRGHWAGEIKNRKADGHYYISWLSLSAVQDNHGNVTHYVSIFSDITSHITEHKKYKKLAHYDFLTGLPNRALLEDRFDQFVLHQKRHNRPESCACLFIDINDFKQINDEYGHKIGDDCLIAVAEILQQAIRQDDTACRLSGDEFVILLTELSDAADVTRVTDNINQQLPGVTKRLGLKQKLTLSIGRSIYPDDASDLEKLLNIADINMYEIKRSLKR